MRGNVHGGKLGQTDKICLGVRITKEAHDRLLEMAKDKEVSISDVVRGLINDAIKKEAV